MLAKLSREVLLDVGLLLVRCVLGCVFIYHGGQKLFGWWNGTGLAGFAGFLEQQGIPYPAYGAVLAGAAEFLGGCALVSGIMMRAAVIPLIATMATAIVYVHPTEFSAQSNGMEYPLTLAVTLASLALMGPGRISLASLPAIAWPRTSYLVDAVSEPSYETL